VYFIIFTNIISGNFRKIERVTVRLLSSKIQITGTDMFFAKNDDGSIGFRYSFTDGATDGGRIPAHSSCASTRRGSSDAGTGKNKVGIATVRAMNRGRQCFDSRYAHSVLLCPDRPPHRPIR